MTSSNRLLRGALIGALVLAVGACTETTDDEVFEEIGVARLLLVDPALKPQDVQGSQDAIQLAEWDVTKATAVSSGGTLDLAFERRCLANDTVTREPEAAGLCSAGIVVESSEEIRELRLVLVTTMRVARGEPLDLPVGAEGDNDYDAVPNDGDSSGSAFDNPCEPGETWGCDDNCPLVANNGVCSLHRERACTSAANCPTAETCDFQADEDGDGTGDACTVFVASLGGVIAVPDSDGDLVPDGVDNCVWIPNTGQDPADPVGDECEQTARVLVDGSETIELRLGPMDLIVPRAFTTFVVTDFNNARTLSCDWDLGECELAADQVRLCAAVNPGVAVNGCP